MRLAFLTHEPFFPPSGGGSAEAVYLALELVRRGHAVELFCPRVADAREVERRFGLRLHEFTTWPMGRYAKLRNLKYIFYPFFLQRMVQQAAAASRFDLIISQHSISAVAAGRLKRTLKIPVVMNFLDYLTAFMETWPAYLAPPSLLGALKSFELSLPARFNADAVLTVSDALADYFVAAGYPRERIRPIYYGYDAELFAPPDAEKTVATDQTRPTIVMHGSLDHHHLGRIALDSIGVVTQAFPSAVFKFVGTRTPAVEKFANLAKARFPSVRVESAGFVPYAEVARHLADASVGIVPYEESTGVHCAFVAKAVEYLAVGLPTVCTPLRSIQTYFKDEPLIRFSGFDGASFGERIVSWLREPPATRRALGLAASRRVKEHLDWGAISRRAIDFVEEVPAQVAARK